MVTFSIDFCGKNERSTKAVFELVQLCKIMSSPKFQWFS